MEHYEEALKICWRATQLDSNNALAYNNKGQALEGLQRFQDALAAYNESIRLDPNLYLAYKNKGLLLDRLDTGNWLQRRARKAEARKALRMAQELEGSGIRKTPWVSPVIR